MCVGVMLKESGYSKLSSVITPQINPSVSQQLLDTGRGRGQWEIWQSCRTVHADSAQKQSSGVFRTDLKGADSQLLLPVQRSVSTNRGDPIGYFQDWEDFVAVCHSGDLWQDPMVPVSWQRARCLLFRGVIRRRSRTKYLED